MIQVENLTVRAGSKALLQKASLTFESGKINLIVGPNGAGKSTLIKSLSRQIKPDEGKILFNGKDLQGYHFNELAKIRAVLSQQIEIPFPLSVWEIVMMGRYPHFLGRPGPHDEQAVIEAMKLFNVEDMADRNYLTLSGGEKQRVNFARVLSQIWFPDGHPRYLLLDEPLTFLDVHFQFQFMHKLTELLRQPDLLVVGVVHDLNLAARFADKVVVLHQGNVLAQGTRDEVLTPENIRTAFHIEPMVHRTSEGWMYLVFR